MPALLFRLLSAILLWTGSNGNIATVGITNAVLTGVSAGKAVITHRFAAGVITTTVTVNPLSASTAGVAVVCQGKSITIINTTPGGAHGIAAMQTAPALAPLVW